MKEITFTRCFDERVFSDHRPDKFWGIIFTVVKNGRLEAVEILWNYTLATLNRNRTLESPYLNWTTECFEEICRVYGAEAVNKAEIRADAVSFANLDEEVARKFKAASSDELSN